MWKTQHTNEKVTDELYLRKWARADLMGQGGHGPQDAKHCATWHWNNTMLVCTATNNAINSIKLCLSFSPGLKLHAVYFKNAPASGELYHPGPLRGLCPWTPLGDLRPPGPLIWPPTPPSRSAPENEEGELRLQFLQAIVQRSFFILQILHQHRMDRSSVVLLLLIGETADLTWKIIEVGYKWLEFLYL